MENKTQTLMQVIICAYAQHRAWDEDDIELRVRKTGDKWDTWIVGLGSEGVECFPSTASSDSTEAESLEASLWELASLLAKETKEQLDVLELLRSIAKASNG